MPNNFQRKSLQLQGITRSIRTMDRRADDLTPVWRKAGSMIARNNSRNFATRGRHYGRAWKPLAASTMAEKLRKGWPKSPLVRTAALKLSFIGRPMGVEVYRRHSATFGSDLQRSVWQQKGTYRHGKRHIPPRVMMRMTRSMRGEIHKMVVEYVVKGQQS